MKTYPLVFLFLLFVFGCGNPGSSSPEADSHATQSSPGDSLKNSGDSGIAQTGRFSGNGVEIVISSVTRNEYLAAKNKFTCSWYYSWTCDSGNAELSRRKAKLFADSIRNTDSLRYYLVQDSALIVLLENGQRKTFLNHTHTDGDDYTAYTYLGHVQETHYVIIEKEVYEDGYLALLDLKNGHEELLENIPAPSADKQFYLAVHSENPMDGSPPGLALYRKDEKGNLVRIFTSPTQNWEADCPVWVNGNTCYLRQYVFSNTPTDYKYIRLTVNSR